MRLHPEVCQCVITSAVQLVFALKLAKRHKSAVVCTELLLKTDVNILSYGLV